MGEEPRKFDMAHLQNLLKQFDVLEEEKEKKRHQEEELRNRLFSPRFDTEEKQIIICQKFVKRWFYRKRWFKIKKMIWRRDLIAKEILSTEETYVNNLNLLSNAFLQPLMEHPKAGKKESVKSIMANIQVIKGYNAIILADLSKRMKGWGTHTKVGDVFIQMAHYLKAYTQYSVHYTECLEDLDQLISKDKKFAAFMDQLRLAPEVATTNMFMRDFLIMPIQRIPRYTLLLKDLLSHTWSDHPDFETLTAAYNQISNIASYVNKAQAENSNNIRMQAVKTSLTGSKAKTLPLLQPHRRFIQEGEVMDANDGNPRQTYLFMFNDMLLWTKPNQTKTKYELLRVDLFQSYLSVREIKHKNGERSGAIGIYEKSRISFFNPAPEEFTLWLTNLERYVAEAVDDASKNPLDLRTQLYLQSQQKASTTLSEPAPHKRPATMGSPFQESHSTESTPSTTTSPPSPALTPSHSSPSTQLHPPSHVPAPHSSIAPTMSTPSAATPTGADELTLSAKSLGDFGPNESIGRKKSGKARNLIRKVSTAFKKGQELEPELQTSSASSSPSPAPHNNRESGSSGSDHKAKRSQSWSADDEEHAGSPH